MKNNILNLNNKINECTSCQLCSAICLTNAIKIKLSEEGFYEPDVDENKCISCGKCLENCYKYDGNIKITEKNKVEAYSGYSKDIGLLKSSTSGGIASHLAEECINNGYLVVGVTYNYEKDVAVTRIAKTIKELEKFKGSKYIQSYSEETLKKMLKENFNKKYAIFGTPCQIYSLNRYITSIGKRDNVVFIDLFCHGCPSLNLWTKYIKYIREKNNMNKFTKVEFRSKKRGWHEFTVYLKDKNKEFISRNLNNHFFNLFFSNNILNEACYKCSLRSTLEYTDIRLGDFWGSKYDMNIKGMSAIAINSEKGKLLFENIKNDIVWEKESFDEVIKAQSYGEEYKIDANLRLKVLKIISEESLFKTVIKRYKKLLTKREQIKVNLKILFSLLPQYFRFKLKKYYHERKKNEKN